MSKPNRKLRVGVTIHIRDGHQSIWENGIFQNCVFLVQLFNLSPEVEKAVLVNGSGAREVHPSMLFDEVGVEMIDLATALETLDIIIEMSSQVPEDWLEKFRDRGGRIAWMRCGNDFVIDIERAMYNKPNAGLCSAKKYDAIWTLPEYKKSCTDYFALTTRAPVKIVPHLWTPEFFEKGMKTLPQGVSFGYKPGRARWRVCSFEPNVCMVKTCVTPMLVCEEAYRKNPKFLEYFRVCNTLHLKENPALVRFATSLDIVKHGVTTFEGRFAIYEYMAHYGDGIVSHHWENGQNYLYYEALYGGYPLIHNSEFIRDLGYFYPDFDCQAGGAALVRAFESHDANLVEYKARATKFLESLDIRHRPNLEAYTAELLALFESPSPTKELAKAQKKSGEAEIKPLEMASSPKPAAVRDESFPLDIPAALGCPNTSSSVPRKAPLPIDKIWVINLERRPDRLEKFKASHPDIADEIQVLKAYDGRTLRLTPKIARLFAPNDFGWNKAKMGCCMSHLELWVQLSREKNDDAIYLICEDDAVLAGGWKEKLASALQNGDAPIGWDVIYLGGNPLLESELIQIVENVSGDIHQITPNTLWGQSPPNRYCHFGAYAYLLSKKGAQRTLELLQRGNGFWNALDHILAYGRPEGDYYERNIYFFHPQISSYYQNEEQAYLNPYNNFKTAGKIDSDIYLESNCFDESAAKELIANSEPYDIHGALEDAKKNSIPRIVVSLPQGFRWGFGDYLMAGFFTKLLLDNGIQAVLDSSNPFAYLLDVPSGTDGKVFNFYYNSEPLAESLMDVVIRQFCKEFGIANQIKIKNYYIPVKYNLDEKVDPVDVVLVTASGPHSSVRNWPFFDELKTKLDHHGVSYIDLNKFGFDWANNPKLTNHIANLIYKSKVFIGLETGASHFATGMLSKKSGEANLIIQSGYVPFSHWTKHYGEIFEPIEVNLDCKGCLLHDATHEREPLVVNGKQLPNRCEKKHFCMSAISAETVFNKIEKKLNGCMVDKLFGLYGLENIPHIRENHRGFAERSGMDYQSYSIKSYYEKWNLIWHLLEEFPDHTLAFIDAHSYFVVHEFSGKILDDIFIQEVNGKVMDNFFIVRSRPRTRRLFFELKRQANLGFALDEKLLFNPTLLLESAKPYGCQITNDLYFNLELAFPSNALELNNILVARYKGDEWSSQLWSAAEILCHHKPIKKKVLSPAEFEIINPGKIKALLTLSSPEPGEPFPEYAIVSECNFRAYAQKHDLTIYIYRAIPDFCQGLHSTWTKPYLLLKHIKQHEYISWADADILISSDFFLPDGHDVIVYSDPGGWLFNAGFMTFRNSDKTLDYLNAVIARSESLDDRSSLYVNGSDQTQFIEEYKIHFPDLLPRSNLVANIPTVLDKLREPGPGLWHFMGINPPSIRAIVMDYYAKNILK